jgi:hypothetical protein
LESSLKSTLEELPVIDFRSKPDFQSTIFKPQA